MTTIKSFEMPEAIVRFTHLQVDTTKQTFSMTVGTKAKGKRSFSEQQVAGNITSELSDFFKLKRPDSIKVAADNADGFEWKRTGTTSTSFERFLVHRNMEFAPGILDTLVFECENDSSDRAANPFKLIMLEGKNILSLVNVASKKRTEIIDVNTGDITTKYTQKWYNDANGAMRPSFVAPKFYKRLIIQRAIEAVPVQG